MCVPTNGELYSSDTACSGDIVILPNDVLQLNSILGNEMLLPQRKFIENPLPRNVSLCGSCYLHRYYCFKNQFQAK